jgi:elongation factor G
MGLVDPARIRNVAVVGHRGAGKTSFVEALLFSAGAKKRLGTIADGTTTMDYDEDEIKRQMTISAGLTHIDWGENRVNLIDTPGEASFISEALGVVPIVETALVVINAVAKVEVQTERVWKRAVELGTSRVAVVNMMDRERADFGEAVEVLRARFGDEVVPMALPIGREGDFAGLVDLLTMKAYSYEGSGLKGKEGAIPDEMSAEVDKAREMLIDRIAESDDALLEKYLEGQELLPEEIAGALRAALASGAVCPVLPVAATKNVGTDRILEVLNSCPSPADRGAYQVLKGASGTDEVSVECDMNAPAALFVFKTIYDQFSGRVNLVRILSGKISTDSQLLNVRANEKERTGNILLMQGKETKGINEAGAGDIVALAKLKEAATGDTLCDPGNQVRFPRYEFSPPAISFAITPKTRGDEEKVSNGLKRLGEEDPAMELRFDPQTKEMLISGTSQVHVEVILDKLKRRFGVEVELHPPQVPYRETVRKKASAQGRHKKQTGGRGQFGDCWIEVTPKGRGEGYEFEDAIFGGAIPRNFIPAVEKGIVEAMGHGVVGGYPVVDVKVKLYDGSFHSVDSSEIAFKLAGSLAWNKAMSEADPVLLEPVMNVEVIAPEENMGDVMGDLSGRRGRPQGSQIMVEMHVIRA